MRTDANLLIGIRMGVFLLLLMPLIVTSQTLFPYIVGKAVYARSIIEIIFGLWLILVYQYPKYRPIRSWVITAFGAYLIVALLAGLFGVSLQRSLWSTYERMQGIVDLAHWFALTVVLASAFRSFQNWRTLLTANLVVSLVIAVLGVAQHYNVNVPGFWYLQGSARLEITLGNATYVGAYMLVNVLIGMGLFMESFHASSQPKLSRAAEMRRRRRSTTVVSRNSSLIWWRFLCATAVVLDLWVLTLSGTRGAFVGLMAGMAAFAVSYLILGKVKWIRLVAMSIIGILMVGTVLFPLFRDAPIVEKVASSNVLVGRLVVTGVEDGSLMARLDSAKVGFKGFVARPILGWGPENFIIAWGRYFSAQSGVETKFDQAHNKLVEELTTKGGLGFLSYGLLWTLMGWIVVKKAKRLDGPEQILVLSVGAALVGYFVQNLFLFDTPATFLQFILLLGVVVNLEKSLEHGTEKPILGRPVGARKSRLWLSERVRGLGVTKALKAETSTWWVRLAVGALVILCLFFLNYKLFNAAIAVVQTASPVTWEQRYKYFDESISSFGPLANYPRLILLAQLTENWGNLSDNEARKGLVMVEKEAHQMIKAEPDGWRLYAALAQFYQKASSLDPKYLEQASLYGEIANRLAPETVEVLNVQAQQQAMEKELDKGGSPKPD